MNQTNQPASFRHLGIYRDGVTWRDATVDSRALKCLFRRGSMTRGKLHYFMGGQNQTLDEVQRSLDRLQAWGMVECRPTFRIDSVVIGLTKVGEFWAEELVGKEQTGESPKEFQE